MNTRTQQITQEFYSLHPDLNFLQEELLKTFQLLSDTFRTGGKLLICGNGGSSADSEHIVGELMKGFLLKRFRLGKRRPFPNYLERKVQRSQMLYKGRSLPFPFQRIPH